MAANGLLIGLLIGIVVVVLAWVLWRTRAFERLGSRLAGDRGRAARAAAAAASPEQLARVAQLVALLASREERRFVRWTPARASSGARFVLGASPAAWYLWLPEPGILVRVPDALVASVEQHRETGAVVRLVCRSRDADAVVTATDGTVVEEADRSVRLAAALLDGLLIVDPEATRAERPAAEDALAAAAGERRTVRLGLAS